MNDRTPGAVLLQPLVLAALATWLVNDHVLKAAYPGFITGKLSDVTSLIVCPLLLFAAIDLRWPRLSVRARRALLLFAAALVGAIMVAVKIDETAAYGYRWGLGLAQWPLRVVRALLQFDPPPNLRPVRLAMDRTDLITLPSLLVAVVLGWRAASVADATAHRGPVR